jgi:hypothetical protein
MWTCTKERGAMNLIANVRATETETKCTCITISETERESMCGEPGVYIGVPGNGELEWSEVWASESWMEVSRVSSRSWWTVVLQVLVKVRVYSRLCVCVCVYWREWLCESSHTNEIFSPDESRDVQLQSVVPAFEVWVLGSLHRWERSYLAGLFRFRFTKIW